MVINIKQIEKFLVFLFFCFLPFQDTILKKTFLGFLGYYLSIIPLILLIIFFAVTKRIIRIPKSFIFYSIYILMISIVMNIPYIKESYFIFLNYKVFSNYVSFILFYFVAVYVGNLKYDLKKFILVAFIINLLGFVISDLFNFNDGYIIHASNEIYSEDLSRLRGFTSESSWFGYLTVLLGGIYVSYLKTRRCKYFR